MERVPVKSSPPQPKSANVLGAVNKPLASAGKQLQSKGFRVETASNEDSSSNPGSPQRSKTRYQRQRDKLTFQGHGWWWGGTLGGGLGESPVHHRPQVSL